MHMGWCSYVVCGAQWALCVVLLSVECGGQYVECGAQWALCVVLLSVCRASERVSCFVSVCRAS